MVYASNTGLITANPLSGVSKAFAAPKKNHMPTLKPDCVVRFKVVIGFTKECAD